MSEEPTDTTAAHPTVTASGSASLPARIGRFRVDAILGRGGMGEVYKAFDPTLQRAVAIKIVRPDIRRPDLLQRLLREAQACARLRHPNVVTVHEAGEIDDVVYIVMEYLQGEDVGAVLRRGTLAFDDKIRILVHVLEALQHAHREGVIHRDIKPSNVHREPDGSVKVVDFGLARICEASPLTQAHAVLCTLDYASPEQLRGESLDSRTDIYSTGALAYELFTGRPPFHQDGGSVGALVLRVVSEPAPPMDVLWSRQFPEIERIVTRAMAKSPADRYQSAADMRNALTAFLAASHEAIVAAQAELDAQAERTTIGAAELAAGIDGAIGSLQPVPPASIVAAASTPSARRWRWLNGAAAAVVVIAAIVAVASGLGLRRPAPPGAPGPAAGQTRALETSTPPAAQAHPSQTAGADQVRMAAAPSTGAFRPEAGAPAPPVSGVPPRKTPPAQAAPAGAPIASAPESSASDVSAKQLFAARPDSPAGVVNAGLRYRLTRKSSDGVEADVDPTETSFRSGDRIRFTFEPNIDGYLYVVQQGSSGKWTVLFPGPDINGGRNAVGRAELYEVPSNDWFRFDDTPGTEHVFVLLSRQPLLQLPGFDRPVTRTESVVASVVEDLRRRIAPRDLVFEKDAKQTASGAASQATYVVNRATLGQSVAASVSLIHTR